MSEIQNNEHGVDSTQVSDSPPPSGSELTNRSRRRFTSAGLSASAVLTLASRPALASRCSISGMNSVNGSAPNVTCMARSAADYLALQNWGGVLDPNSAFDALMLPAPIMNDIPNLTILQALALPGPDLRREATAGILNSRIFPPLPDGSGPGDFGYTEAQYRDFIATSDSMLLFDNLQALNNR